MKIRKLRKPFSIVWGEIMSRLDFTVVENEYDRVVLGLRQKSNDKTQAKDIPSLSKRFYEVVSKGSGEVIPFFVISKDYSESTRDFHFLSAGLLKMINSKHLLSQKGFI